MSLQNTIISRYREIHGKITINEMARNLGISAYRVNRIMSGGQMKVLEFEKMKRAIEKRMELDIPLQELVNLCFFNLPLKSIKEIEQFMNRKLALWKIKQD